MLILFVYSVDSNFYPNEQSLCGWRKRPNRYPSTLSLSFQARPIVCLSVCLFGKPHGCTFCARSLAYEKVILSFFAKKKIVCFGELTTVVLFPPAICPDKTPSRSSINRETAAASFLIYVVFALPLRQALSFFIPFSFGSFLRCALLATIHLCFHRGASGDFL